MDAREEFASRLWHRRHIVRKAWAFTTSVRSTVTTSTTCCRCCVTYAMPRPGPILVHVVTQKGKGYAPAETSADKYHGVVKFDVATGAQAKSKSTAPQYTKVFGESLVKEARKDDKVVAITAAMPSGTGVDLFAKEFPNRSFDVGIAEQHAVTFAGGLAAEGYKPFAAIYSTFLQRAYDQVVHDIAIKVCRFVSQSTAPASSVPTGRHTSGRSTSLISVVCPALS